MTPLLITGTDTGIGKTYVTCMLARQLRRRGHAVGIYKPVCSGGERSSDGAVTWEDLDALSAALGDEVPVERICPQRFIAPVAPPIAARLEGRAVDEDVLRAGCEWWRDRCQVLLIEGVGGLLCPLSESLTVADWAEQMRFPLLVVSPLKLGTVNHTLLTLEAARTRGLDVRGILFNEVTPASDQTAAQRNQEQIQAWSDAPVLGRIPHGGQTILPPAGAESTMDWTRVILGRS